MHQASYRVRVVSADGGRVDGSCGVSILASKAGSLSHDDTVIVVGSPTSHLEGMNTDALKTVQRLSKGARRVASVCTGAFVLAEAGLLDGKRATTHWRYAATLQRRFPSVRVDADRIYVKDGETWTSAGISAGIDLALAMIEEDFGLEVSKAVARDLVVYHRRPGGQSQFSTMLELEPQAGRIRNALAFAREHLHERLTIDMLAEAACVSPRQFQRLFTTRTGDTPARAVERLRVEVAKPRVEEGDESLAAIARSVGFGDANRMRRSFVRIFGRSPQDIRRSSRFPAEMRH
jgi:transcriptional regulator GlxA family with amidase domain